MRAGDVEVSLHDQVAGGIDGLRGHIAIFVNGKIICSDIKRFATQIFRQDKTLAQGIIWTVGIHLAQKLFHFGFGTFINNHCISVVSNRMDGLNFPGRLNNLGNQRFVFPGNHHLIHFVLGGLGLDCLRFIY